MVNPQTNPDANPNAINNRAARNKGNDFVLIAMMMTNAPKTEVAIPIFMLANLPTLLDT